MPADSAAPLSVVAFEGPLADAPFYISANESVTRPRQTLKHGDTFIVLDNHGDIGATAGIFFDGTSNGSRLVRQQ